jgi:NAD(P)-dependent dehydrogenase (short-subunit alcohol dehydrogenase family)
MQLENTAAIVTGGASGLGGATARALAAKGAQVFVFDLPASIEGAEQVSGVEYVEVDVTDAASVQAGVDRAASAGVPLRTVVNCAGIGPSQRILSRGKVHDLDFFAKVVQVNLVGTFNVLALAAEKIAETEGDEFGQRGVMINTASVAAFEGQVGQAAYAASKGGIVGLNLPAARTSSAPASPPGCRSRSVWAGPRSTPSWRSRSSTTTTSTARSSGWTAHSAWPPADRYRWLRLLSSAPPRCPTGTGERRRLIGGAPASRPRRAL